MEDDAVKFLAKKIDEVKIQTHSFSLHVKERNKNNENKRKKEDCGEKSYLPPLCFSLPLYSCGYRLKTERRELKKSRRRG